MNPNILAFLKMNNLIIKFNELGTREIDET
jgi:hypothetical protein